MPILSDALDKLTKTRQPIHLDVVSQLEVVLETLTQIRVQNEANFLRLLIEIITVLSQNIGDQNVFYLIELAV